jgi:hypothetical protein
MTDVRRLTAGRELDALVAEKVMGWSPQSVAHHRAWYPSHDSDAGLPGYSEDIAAAWEVVELVSRMNDQNGANLGFELQRHADGEWYCLFGSACTRASTAALTICLAALEAVGHE